MDISEIESLSNENIIELYDDVISDKSSLIALKESVFYCVRYGEKKYNVQPTGGTVCSDYWSSTLNVRIWDPHTDNAYYNLICGPGSTTYYVNYSCDNGIHKASVYCVKYGVYLPEVIYAVDDCSSSYSKTLNVTLWEPNADNPYYTALCGGQTVGYYVNYRCDRD